MKSLADGGWCAFLSTRNADRDDGGRATQGAIAAKAGAKGTVHSRLKPSALCPQSGGVTEAP
jgi:hypothetical protein